MWTLISIALIVVATFAFLVESYLLVVGCLLVSALLFIRGNRIKHERQEAERHRETIAILRDKK